ncbi:MAG: hypothetical protein ACE5FI_04790 [Anaerolineales bacterium]
MATTLNIRREYVLAVLAAFFVVAVIGVVAAAAFLVVQSDAALANSVAGFVRLGQAGAPLAR